MSLGPPRERQNGYSSVQSMSLDSGLVTATLKATRDSHHSLSGVHLHDMETRACPATSNGLYDEPCVDLKSRCSGGSQIEILRDAPICFEASTAMHVVAPVCSHRPPQSFQSPPNSSGGVSTRFHVAGRPYFIWISLSTALSSNSFLQNSLMNYAMRIGGDFCLAPGACPFPLLPSAHQLSLLSVKTSTVHAHLSSASSVKASSPTQLQEISSSWRLHHWNFLFPANNCSASSSDPTRQSSETYLRG